MGRSGCVSVIELTGWKEGTYHGPMTKQLPSSYHDDPSKAARRLPDIEPELGEDPAGRPVVRFIPSDMDGPRTVVAFDPGHIQAILAFVEGDEVETPVPATLARPDLVHSNGRGCGAPATRIVSRFGKTPIRVFPEISSLRVDDEGYLFVEFSTGKGSPPAILKLDSYLQEELAALFEERVA